MSRVEFTRFLIQKLKFCPSFRPSNARIFAKKSARLLQKMSPSEEFATLRVHRQLLVVFVNTNVAY